MIGKFNENSRVKIPAILHLTRLGYPFLPKAKMINIHQDTNIFMDVFKNFENNTFNVVTELTYKNGEDEFRPDITVLINGMPLVFIEVKKPNNQEGILAERDRINVRFKNKKFKKFINITQLLIFSNNNEYDEDAVMPVQGAFYATPDLEEAKFNFFREEDNKITKEVSQINEI